MMGEIWTLYGGGQKGSLARLKQHPMEECSASISGRGGQAKAGPTVCNKWHYGERSREVEACGGSR